MLQQVNCHFTNKKQKLTKIINKTKLSQRNSRILTLKET